MTATSRVSCTLRRSPCFQQRHHLLGGCGDGPCCRVRRKRVELDPALCPGVFVSFTLSQIGMVKHWNRHLREGDKSERAPSDEALAGDQHSRVPHDRLGADHRPSDEVHPWRLPRGHRNADPLLDHAFGSQALRPSRRGTRDPCRRKVTLPSRVHAIVLVSKIHKPTLRALAYARASRPSTLEGVTVSVDPGTQRRWRRTGNVAAFPCH